MAVQVAEASEMRRHPKQIFKSFSYPTQYKCMEEEAEIKLAQPSTGGAVNISVAGVHVCVCIKP